MLELILGLIVIVVIVLSLTGKGRTIIKGFVNLFFEDIAKTPKGAASIYTQAIEEAQHDYNKASNNLRKIAGMLETSKNNLAKSKTKLTESEARCEELAKNQKFDALDMYAQKVEEFQEDISLYTAEINKYTPMFKDAKRITDTLEQKLIKLKKDRKVVVRQLEVNKQTKEMYDSLDELKHVKSTSKLLDSVKEGVISTGEESVGAKTVYDNKHSTKLERIESDIKSSRTNDYVEGLKKRYQK